MKKTKMVLGILFYPQRYINYRQQIKSYPYRNQCMEFILYNFLCRNNNPEHSP